MRLFIAIDLSKEAQDELKSVQSFLLDENVKAAKTREFHLTLKFLGEVDEKKAEDVIAALKKIKFSPLDLKITGLGVFPNRKYIRVLWIGIDENDELKKLYFEIKKTLPEFKDDHDFSPHLTLARVKIIYDKKLFLQKLEKYKPKEVKFEAKSFVLYKSTLTPQGPVYEKVEEFF